MAQSASGYGGRRKTRKQCNCRALHLEALEDRRLLTSADIVFLVDESGSGDVSNMWAWLKDTVFAPNPVSSNPIKQSLDAQGITEVRYGLIGFGGQATNRAHSFVISPGGDDPLFGNDGRKGDGSHFLTESPHLLSCDDASACSHHCRRFDLPRAQSE
jgi:hypothetical protein